MGHITSECFHITDAVLDGAGSGLRSSGSEPEVPFPSRAVLGSVTEGCVVLGGGVLQSKIQPMAAGVKNICGGLCLPFLWKGGGPTVLGITNL